MPDLNQLAQKTDLDKPKASADPATNIDDPREESGPIKLQTSSPTEEDATNEFVKVSSADDQNLEKKTDLYNPSISNLLDKLDEPEIAVEINATLAAIERLTNHVKGDLEPFKDFEDLEAPKKTQAILAARETAKEVEDLLEKLPSDDPDLEIPHKDLRSLFLILKRNIDKHPLREPEPEKKQETVQAPEEKRSSSRFENWPRRWLLAGAVLSIALILMVKLGEEHSETTEKIRTTDGVTTVNHAAGGTEEQLSKGIPSIVEVELIQLQDASLVAKTLVLDPDGDKTKVTYKWIENGKIIEVESRGVLPGASVAGGSDYQVTVEVSDGKHASKPLTTLPVRTFLGKKQRSQSEQKEGPDPTPNKGVRPEGKKGEK